MAEDLDAETKLELYKLVISRYRDLINQNESRSISEIRQMVSPYNDFIRKMREKMLSDIVPYDYRNHFFTAVERAISYIRTVRTCQFAFTFWMSFEEIDKLKIAGPMDKAIFLAALIRSFESADARVIVTKKGRNFVKFSWKDNHYLISPESGSLLSGEDSMKLFSDDPIAYSFSDLAYENFEEV